MRRRTAPSRRHGAERWCRLFRLSYRRPCCSAARTSPPPSAAWLPPTSRSASPAPPTSPNLNLSASYGFGASAASGLFNASNSLWSLGLSAAQTLFDAGATRARVAGAEASRDAAIARYRQTVLAAFADVEDQLAASRALEQQQAHRRAAAAAADQVEQQMLNRYRAGQVGYTDVVQAQVTALNARRALLQAQADRQTTAVALIQSLGGGWHAER
ncbi:TolC family protein [Pseudoduganella sp. UC29_71]|uniref:TolC family protein n=1 Tax=Pseudoduganella sp. UC29_71 TaxID=3350174 RepID=UPI00366FBCE3